MKNLFIIFARLALFALIAIASAPAQTNSVDSSPAERVFIGNAGSVNDDQSPAAGEYAERAYNEFFLAMEQWGHYEIVASELRADWIFEVSTTNREKCPSWREQRTGSSREEDHIRINILMIDAKTKALRTRLSEDVGIPRWYTSLDKLFDQTIIDLLHDLKEEVGAAVTSTPKLPHDQPLPPVPPQIGLAQKVYIHNSGVTDDPGGRYSGGNAGLYDEFAAQLKSWGRYQIVPEAQADLVLDISFSIPSTCAFLDEPQLHLYVHDARTDTALWAFSRPVAHALRAATARKNFAQDVAALVRDLRGVAEAPTWALNASLPAKPGAVASLISSAPDSNTEFIPASISVAPVSAKSGSKVSATVIVNNTTKQVFNFVYPQGDPLTCVIVVHRADGTEVKETEEGTKIIAAHVAWKGRSASYELNPGDKQTRQCSVSSLFDMSSPGKYLIEVKGLDGRPVISNVAAVTIVPK